MTRLHAILAAVALVAFAAGGYIYYARTHGGDRFAACRTSTVAGGSGAIGGPFTLVNGDGKTVTDKDVIKGPTLIYFGYTFCPDVCPLDNARNAAAVDILAGKGIDVTPVFITVDPKRDTPEVVKEFAANFSPKMIGLTGTPAEVNAAVKAYKAFYKIQDPSQKYYLINHSTFTYLVLPRIGFVDFFRREVSPKEMASRVACYVNAAR